MNKELILRSKNGTVFSVKKGGVTYFGVDNPVSIIDFQFSSQRMGTSAVTASIKSPVCLDDFWAGGEYVVLDGVKYVRMTKPSSSKDNTGQYKHDITFQCERDILLNNVYFVDAVSDSASTKDRFQSGNRKVYFYGTLNDFVARVNDVINYRLPGSGITVTVGGSVGETERKYVSFEDKTLFEALQSAYSDYWDVPFYFDGNTCVFEAVPEGVSPIVVQYGGKNQLLSVSKTNTGSTAINRLFGQGSETNVPYYYPNPSPSGTIAISLGGAFRPGSVTIEDMVKFSRWIGINDKAFYWHKYFVDDKKYGFETDLRDYGLLDGDVMISQDVEANEEYGFEIRVGYKYTFIPDGSLKFHVTPHYSDTDQSAQAKLYRETMTIVEAYEEDKRGNRLNNVDVIQHKESVRNYIDGSMLDRTDIATISLVPSIPEGKREGFFTEERTLVIKGSYSVVSIDVDKIHMGLSFDGYGVTVDLGDYWKREDNYNTLRWSLSGLKLATGVVPVTGDYVVQDLVSKAPCSSVLMPSIYRETLGVKKSVEAVNNKWEKEDGSYYAFDNPYSDNTPVEYFKTFEDIKPTIVGIKNSDGQYINVIEDVYFEPGYNPRAEDVDTVPQRSRFFVKLRKFDGPDGFNLFDCAIDEEDMIISMTSGNCGACEFKILVDSELQKNVVQVNEDGSLKKTEKGLVVTSGTAQDVQNDTKNNSVWICIAVDESTYGGKDIDAGIMPSGTSSGGVATTGQYPVAGDSFVFLHILLPDAYILAAEKRLQLAMLDYLEENNVEKFSYSVKLSRVWAAQNPAIAGRINGNSILTLIYNGKEIAPLYVTGFTYTQKEGEALPEIAVEIKDTLNEVSGGGLSRKISDVVNDTIKVKGLGTVPSVEDLSNVTVPSSLNDKDVVLVRESNTRKWIARSYSDGGIKEIEMNGEKKEAVNGVVDLGTVLTEHQSLDDYVKREDLDSIDVSYNEDPILGDNVSSAIGALKTMVDSKVNPSDITNCVKSTNDYGHGSIGKVVVITKDEYDSIVPESNVMYLIVD